MRKFSFLICLLISSVLLAGNFKKGYEALEVFDFFKAKTEFTSALKKHKYASGYGLAVIHLNEKNPFHNLDSAIVYARIAEQNITPTKKSDWKKLKAFNIDSTSIFILKEKIFSASFQFAKQRNTVDAYEHFIQFYAESAQRDLAVILQSKLAFEAAGKEHTYAAYLSFMKRFPESREYSKAKELYEETLFISLTRDNSISSYEQFIQKYPESPFVADASDSLYAIYTSDGDAKTFENFIRKYPENPNVTDAWKILYSLSTKDFDPVSIRNFTDRFPDYPFRQSADRDIELSQTLFLPVRENDHWGFVDTLGKQMIPFQYQRAEIFSEGLAEVVLNNKSGFITKSGSQAIPFLFDEVANGFL